MKKILVQITDQPPGAYETDYQSKMEAHDKLRWEDIKTESQKQSWFQLLAIKLLGNLSPAVFPQKRLRGRAFIIPRHPVPNAVFTINEKNMQALFEDLAILRNEYSFYRGQVTLNSSHWLGYKDWYMDEMTSPQLDDDIELTVTYDEVETPVLTYLEAYTIIKYVILAGYLDRLGKRIDIRMKITEKGENIFGAGAGNWHGSPHVFFNCIEGPDIGLHVGDCAR